MLSLPHEQFLLTAFFFPMYDQTFLFFHVSIILCCKLCIFIIEMLQLW